VRTHPCTFFVRSLVPFPFFTKSRLSLRFQPQTQGYTYSLLSPPLRSKETYTFLNPEEPTHGNVSPLPFMSPRRLINYARYPKVPPPSLPFLKCQMNLHFVPYSLFRPPPFSNINKGFNMLCTVIPFPFSLLLSSRWFLTAFCCFPARSPLSYPPPNSPMFSNRPIKYEEQDSLQEDNYLLPCDFPIPVAIGIRIKDMFCRYSSWFPGFRTLSCYSEFGLSTGGLLLLFYLL